MAWIAPIVGYSDNLGYLRCSDCADETQQIHAIPGDQYFYSDDVCECCRKRLQRIESKDYVRV